jgi:putative protease
MPAKKKKGKKKKKRAARKATKRKAVKRKSPKIKAVKRKVSKRKPAKKRTTKKKPAKKKTKPAYEGNVIGVITHYFPKVNAGVIKLKAPLAVGDTIKIKGHTTDFTQMVTSIQLEHGSISSAKKGQEIGLLVASRVRHHDVVIKL